jgi:signal transduction histidine kinase
MHSPTRPSSQILVRALENGHASCRIKEAIVAEHRLVSCCGLCPCFADAGGNTTDLDSSEAVSLPLTMGRRPYIVMCTPASSYVDSAYSRTPIIISVLAGAVIFLNIVFIITAAAVYEVKRARDASQRLRRTNEAKTEALRILSKSQALSEQHNQSKSDFLAFLCHELRNPLHAVSSLVEFLTHSETLTSHMDQDDVSTLETIEQQVKLMNAIVNDALDLSKIEAGQMRMECVAFNLKKLALSLASGYRIKALNQGISLHVEISDLIPHTLYSDPTRIRQVFTNLLSNAIKFTTVSKEARPTAAGKDAKDYFDDQLLLLVCLLFL